MLFLKCGILLNSVTLLAKPQGLESTVSFVKTDGRGKKKNLENEYQIMSVLRGHERQQNPTRSFGKRETESCAVDASYSVSHRHFVAQLGLQVINPE